jgi:C-terminal processing protease CtpA/Prc
MVLSHLIAPFAALALSMTVQSPASREALGIEQQAAIAVSIGDMLEERYIFPEVAAKCAAKLREQWSGGAQGEVAEPEAFAKALTEALRSVSKDKHILVRVRAAKEEAPTTAETQSLRARSRRFERARAENFGFDRVEHLNGNVGYLDLRSFAAPPGGGFDAAVAAMALVAHSDALIFDLRKNSGGSPGMVQFLTSHLFDEPTHLNSLYFREGDRTQEFWTHGVPGASMPDVPVFVLTSSETFSAAEEFSYNLRALKRATLVGETTRGGANPGGLFPIDAQFEMVIPTGRAINPITGTNWEGVGVVPHVPVAAKAALDTALELARKAATERRADIEAHWAEVESLYRAALEEPDSDQGATTLGLAVERGYGWRLINESDIDAIGHDLLDDGRASLAIAAFEFNVETFPGSERAKESLDEALRR